jgi:XTP/dITP diphosphohydrolase
MNKEIVIATHNKHKFQEIKKILSDIPFRLIGGGSIAPHLVVDEIGDSYLENAVLKALAFSKKTGLPSLADDSGLEVAALKGEPGVKSNRYFGPDLSGKEKAEALLKLLDRISHDDRSARFICVAVLAIKKEIVHVTRGIVEGYIGHDLRGNDGFGYDPIFVYPPEKKTFAELKEEVKNEVSHRSIAMRKMKDFLLQLDIDSW